MLAHARRAARTWHAVTFVVAAFAVLFQLILVVRGHQHLGESLPGIEAAGRPDLTTRIVRFGSFLTIWFNVLVAGTSALLAVNPVRDGRVWRALRLDAVVLAVAGGIVHWFLLRPILDLHGADYVADKLLHIAVPLLVSIGWARFGPRNRIDARDVRNFLIVPLVWLAYTLIRGAMVGWYPYPFIDVGLHGYATVSATSLVIALFMFGLAAGAMALDRRLD